MRDPRYWQAGHPERAAHVASVTRGYQELYAGEGETAAKVVHVRGYHRTRNGHPENVSDYSQRRRGRQQPARPPRAPSLLQPPAGAPAPAGPSPTPRVPPTFVAFIRGFGDATEGSVRRTQERIFGDPSISSQVNPGYYSYEDRERLLSDIRALPSGTRIVRVGHSWGGDTAAQVAASMGASGRPVDLLVTIDPVGRGVSEQFFRRVRSGAAEWVNVRASGGAWWDPSNLIAQAGSPYGDGPARFATSHTNAPYSHARFEAMLGTNNARGRSIRDQIVYP